MSEFEPPVYEAGTFWGQVKRGITGLVLPENVSDPKSEAAAWGAWHAYLAGRTQPTWHFDKVRWLMVELKLSLRRGEKQSALF